MTITAPAFQQNNIILRPQATVNIDTSNQQWLLDNDSENSQNFSTGYMSFVLLVNGSVLDVYGTAIRIIRINDDGDALVICRYPFGLDGLDQVRNGGYAVRISGRATEPFKTGSMTVHERFVPRSLAANSPARWSMLRCAK